MGCNASKSGSGAEAPKSGAPLPKTLMEAKEPGKEPEKKPRQVLVTGATGLLGRPLVSELARRGFQLTTLSSRMKDQLPQETQEILANASAQHFGFDLVADTASDCPELRKLLTAKKFDLIINLAADRGGTAPGGKGATERRMNNSDLNTQMPQKLAQLAQEFSVKMIHMSTEYVWSGSDNEPTGYPAVSVNKDPRFVEVGAPYAMQKRNAENALMAFPAVTILRLPVLYGPMLVAKEDGTAGSSIQNFLTENTWKHDTWQRRYPTYTPDVAFVLGALSQKLCTTGLRERVYNYGAEESVSKFEFIALFADAAGLPLDRIAKEDASSRPADKRPPYDVKLDNSATKMELAGDWREPSRLNVHVKDVWLPHFKEQISALKDTVCTTQVKVDAVIEDVSKGSGMWCCKVSGS